MRTSKHVGAKWKEQLFSQSTPWFHYALLMGKEKNIHYNIIYNSRNLKKNINNKARMKHYFTVNIMQPYKYYTSKSFSMMRKKCVSYNSRWKWQKIKLITQKDLTNANPDMEKILTVITSKWWNERCVFLFSFFFCLIQMFNSKHEIIFIIRIPKFKLLKEQLALKIWMMNRLRIFLPRSSASHHLKGKVQSYRVTVIRVLGLCLHWSVSVTHKALSIKA